MGIGLGPEGSVGDFGHVGGTFHPVRDGLQNASGMDESSGGRLWRSGPASCGRRGVGVEAAVGPRELSLDSGVAHPAHRLPQEVASRRAPGSRTAISTSVPAATATRQAPLDGGGRPPWPGRRSHRRPAPAAQARASSSRLTRSSWRSWPHRKLRRKVPRVDGALTVQPSTRPVRGTSASGVDAAPSQGGGYRVISLSPALARPGASRIVPVNQLGKTETPGQGGGQPARHWPPGGDHQRRGWVGGLKW